MEILKLSHRVYANIPKLALSVQHRPGGEQGVIWVMRPLHTQIGM